MDPLIILIIVLAVVLFIISWWWDDKVNKMRHQELGEFAIDVGKELGYIKGQLHELLHETQQIKHRLTTIRRTTKKDLKSESVFYKGKGKTWSNTPTYFLKKEVKTK